MHCARLIPWECIVLPTPLGQPTRARTSTSPTSLASPLVAVALAAAAALRLGVALPRLGAAAAVPARLEVLKAWYKKGNTMKICCCGEQKLWDCVHATLIHQCCWRANRPCALHQTATPSRRLVQLGHNMAIAVGNITAHAPLLVAPLAATHGALADPAPLKRCTSTVGCATYPSVGRCCPWLVGRRAGRTPPPVSKSSSLDQRGIFGGTARAKGRGGQATWHAGGYTKGRVHRAGV